MTEVRSSLQREFVQQALFIFLYLAIVITRIGRWTLDKRIYLSSVFQRHSFVEMVGTASHCPGEREFWKLIISEPHRASVISMLRWHLKRKFLITIFSSSMILNMKQQSPMFSLFYLI